MPIETEARILASVEYQMKRWLESPLIQRWFALNAESAAAAQQARIAVAASRLRTASLLIGAADLAVTLGVPVAVWIGVFAAMGAPYAQARSLVQSENFMSGFSQGFVAGALKWEWPQTTSRFFKFSPGQINHFDESLSFYGANAYNDGLRAGFIHGQALDEKARKAVLGRLRSLSPSTRAGNWDRRQQIGYVIELAAAGRRSGIFKAS